MLQLGPVVMTGKTLEGKGGDQGISALQLGPVVMTGKTCLAENRAQPRWIASIRPRRDDGENGHRIAVALGMVSALQLGPVVMTGKTRVVRVADVHLRRASIRPRRDDGENGAPGGRTRRARSGFN